MDRLHAHKVLALPSTPPTTEVSNWTAIARLMRPQGRRGELLAEPLTDLEEVFSTGRSVLLARRDSEEPADEAARVLEDCWSPTGRNAGRIVLKLSGCDSINDAEALAGRTLLISKADMPELDEDTFFVGDLVGCTFFDGETQVGTIVDVEFPVGPDGKRLEDSAPLLVVELTGEEEPALVPFIRAWLNEVDIEARLVKMQLPEGLLHGAELAGDEAEESDAV
jgi:16S rRNA processing protein RimM